MSNATSEAGKVFGVSQRALATSQRANELEISDFVVVDPQQWSKREARIEQPLKSFRHVDWEAQKPRLEREGFSLERFFSSPRRSNPPEVYRVGPLKHTQQAADPQVQDLISRLNAVEGHHVEIFEQLNKLIHGQEGHVSRSQGGARSALEHRVDVAFLCVMVAILLVSASQFVSLVSFSSIKLPLFLASVAGLGIALYKSSS